MLHVTATAPSAISTVSQNAPVARTTAKSPKSIGLSPAPSVPSVPNVFASGEPVLDPRGVHVGTILFNPTARGGVEGIWAVDDIDFWQKVKYPNLLLAVEVAGTPLPTPLRMFVVRPGHENEDVAALRAEEAAQDRPTVYLQRDPETGKMLESWDMFGDKSCFFKMIAVVGATERRLREAREAATALS